MLQELDIGATLTALIEQFGAAGAMGGALLWFMYKTNRSCQDRIEKLENSQQEQHVQHLADQKSMISDYMELVRSKTSILADLTGCLKAIKDTLDRIERKG